MFSLSAPRRFCAPSFLRLLLTLVSLTAGLLLSSCAAQAGTYTWTTTDPSTGATTAQSPTFTGGVITYADGQPPGPYLTSATGFNVPGPPYNITNMSGTVQAAYTWQSSGPGDVPPQAVIITEQRDASWYFYYTSPPSGASCSDGLSGTSNAEVDTVVAGSPPYSTYTGNSSGTYYSVQTPGASGAVSFSITGLQSDMPFLPVDQTQNWAYAALNDQLAISPVTISLSGTTQDSSGNQNILVGQQCTASLSGIPSGCTLSNWNWSVTGTTFQSWSASNSYTIEVDGPGASAYSTASWFWDDLKTAKDSVTCTVTVTPPSGQGSPFPITVTQPVNVAVPAWSCKATGGTMQVNTLAGAGNGTDYWLYAGPASGSNTGRGMDWVASVASPGPPFSGSGSLEMVQTETPNSTYTSSAGVIYTRSNNGQQGLDTSYPYGWQSAPPSPPSYESGDSPGLDLTGMASAQLKYTFVDTLMYEPPGDSQYVPIATFTWSTNGNAQLPATKNWADYGSGSAGAVTPSGTSNFTASIAFPSWKQNVGNGTWSWVAAK